MTEYIEREEAIEAAKHAWGKGIEPSQYMEIIPAADVEPVRHGRWIKESDGGTRCSVCNKRVRDVTGGWDEPVDLSDMPYCPKCGARMDEEEDHGN